MARKSIDLLEPTHPDWVNVIVENFDEFLRDHANCERKASALAMSMVVKQPDRTEIVPTLIAIAKEELEHFEQVYRLVAARGLGLTKDGPDPYVNALLGALRHGREERFLDRMLAFSLVECRGAERFRIVHEALDDPALCDFYRKLWAAETKHGHQFVDMVLPYFDRDVVYRRLHELAVYEAEVIRTLPWRASLH